MQYTCTDNSSLAGITSLFSRAAQPQRHVSFLIVQLGKVRPRSQLNAPEVDLWVRVGEGPLFHYA